MGFASAGRMDAFLLTIGILLVVVLVAVAMTRRRSSPPGEAFEPEPPIAPGAPRKPGGDPRGSDPGARGDFGRP